MQTFLALLAEAQQAVNTAEEKLSELKAANVTGEIGKVKKLFNRYAVVEQSIREEKRKVLTDLLEIAVAGGIKDCYISLGTCYTYEICSSDKITVSVPADKSRYITSEDRKIMRSFDVQQFVNCRQLWFFHFCQMLLYQIERILENRSQEQVHQIGNLLKIKEKIAELAARES